MTLSGKTTVAKKIAQTSKSSDRGVLVYDPLKDPSWGADFVTDDIRQLLKIARMNKSCTLIVDEAATACGNHDRDTHWLATQSRHWGHQSIFIAQRPSQIAVNIRDNCAKLFCFRISADDAKIYANEWCAPELLEAPTLPAGECFYVPRFGAATRMKIF